MNDYDDDYSGDIMGGNQLRNTCPEQEVVDLRDVLQAKVTKMREFYYTWNLPKYQPKSTLNLKNESEVEPPPTLSSTTIKQEIVDDIKLESSYENSKERKNLSNMIKMEPSPPSPSSSAATSAANTAFGLFKSEQIDVDDVGDTNVYLDNRIQSKNHRQRKAVVYNFSEANTGNSVVGDENFPSVSKLVQMYAEMIEKQQKKTDNDEINQTQEDENTNATPLHAQKVKPPIRPNNNNYCRSPISDEGCGTPLSAFNSSDEEDVELRNKEKVARSTSSDSALGLDDDLSHQEYHHQHGGEKRRLTLTVADIPLRPALYPLADPSMLPSCESPTNYNAPSEMVGPIRSTMILEANIIELPALQQQKPLDGCDDAQSDLSVSRRESAISNHSEIDFVNAATSNRVRYMRTPSVVVSDYSDEQLANGVCGVTIEEIEYFQQHRLRRRSSYENASDVSASSSCSNLNFCGSHISLLDDTGLRTPERKTSTCSTCTNLSCDEDDAFNEQLKDALIQQQQQQQQKKKVSSGLND